MLGPTAAALALWLAPGAAQPAAKPPSAAQATYDAAQGAFDRGDWGAAAQGFGAVLPQARTATLSPSQAVIASRLGYAFLRLGRLEEARAMEARAVVALPQSDPGDLADAWRTAGDAARFAFDYRDAAQAYGRAVAYATRAGDKGAVLSARMGSALAMMSVDPAAVGADLDRLLADKTLTAGLSRANLSEVVDLRARAALNAGDLVFAAKTAERAIDLSGGLTLEDVSGRQVAIRNDAALISGLRHEDAKTREYLAFTGAGHMRDMDWIPAYAGDLPVCGEAGDVRPDDVAALQFAIDDHGEVKGAVPLYVSRPGDMGAAFARAVSGWRWDPDALKKVEPFWRATLVLQLRCQTRPTPESLGAPVYAELADWLKAKGVATSAEALQAPVAADDGRLKSDGPDAIGPLTARVARGGDAKAAARAQAVLDANHAPPSAYAVLVSAGATNVYRRARGARSAAAAAEWLRGAAAAYAARYPQTLGVAWLELQRALYLEEARDFRGASEALAEVLAVPQSGLPEGAPIRRVALLHAGLTARRLGEAASADARIAASGLNAEQCSVFDTHPIFDGHGMSGDSFPEEANRWGFEGYTREAFDIEGDGHVTNVRTVVAYPPFIFDQASEKGARTFRYLPPKIGDQSVGCTGQTQGIRFMLPK